MLDTCPPFLLGSLKNPNISKAPDEYLVIKLYEGEEVVQCVGLENTNLGMVLDIGEDCCKGEDFKELAAWCKVGCLVIFSKKSAYKACYRGIPAVVVRAVDIQAGIYDPETIRKYIPN